MVVAETEETNVGGEEMRNYKERSEDHGDRNCLESSQLLGKLRFVWICVGAG